MSDTGLQRFTDAHRRDYQTALWEIQSGRKQSHWMWYIFPQIQGLGRSSTAAFYAIRDLEEANAFLRDPYLSGNLLEICHALLQLESSDAGYIFGSPDDKKLRSSMTLFYCVAGKASVFARVLDKFFGGKPDRNTLRILNLE